MNTEVRDLLRGLIVLTGSISLQVLSIWLMIELHPGKSIDFYVVALSFTVGAVGLGDFFWSGLIEGLKSVLLLIFGLWCFWTYIFPLTVLFDPIF